MKTKGGIFYLERLLILFLLSGFFYYPEIYISDIVSAETPELIINEVAWMGTTVSANNEWVELKNTTDTEINLEGWSLSAIDGQPIILLSGTISAGNYFLLERTDDNSVPEIEADQIFLGALGNSGEILELKNNAGELIDKIDASAGWPSGDNTNKLTMSRNNEGAWVNSMNPGGTPKQENINDPVSESDNGNNEVPVDNTTDTDSNVEIPDTSRGKKYKFGDMLINEFCVDPADGDEEWIEVVNKKNEEIDLDDWVIEEGSGSKTKITGKIGGKKYSIISKPKGSLNNSGDIIYLRDAFGSIIDQVAYGSWDDGYIEDNAPTANDPNVIARYAGIVQNINSEDFAVTSLPTKSKENIIVNDEIDENPSNDFKNYNYSEDIYISEIFPNPVGSDNENEFIELYNAGSDDIDLTGWIIQDESGAKYEFHSTNENIIKSKGYLNIYRSQSNIPLNNNDDSVSIIAPLKTRAKQKIKYTEAKEGFSYNAIVSESDWKKAKWEWSENITPGKGNEIKKINHKPVLDFDFPKKAQPGTMVLFDSSDTFDEDGDKLAFSWEFGDGAKSNLKSPEHLFIKEGIFKVKLSVSDGIEEVTKEKKINISALISITGYTVEKAEDWKILLNEMMPSPEGSDEDGEWIELFNSGETRVSLLNWSLSDLSGKKYEFTDPFWIEAGKYFLLERSESGISLNNSAETIRLFNGEGKKIDETKYEKAKEGLSFARNKNIWQWSVEPTPGEENSIILEQVTKKKSGIKNTTKKSKNFEYFDLQNLKDLEVGDRIKTKGIVSVVPGILGSQYFYILEKRGIQVYNYKKDFPELKTGDLIEVAGEISSLNGEMRIKTTSKSDMKIIEHRKLPESLVISCDKITDDLIGNLLTVKGEIAEIKGSSIYLDDGTEEAVIYLKKNTGIGAKNFNVGEKITLTGIASKTSSGIRIMPRSPEDIIKEENIGKVLGETSKNSEWDLEQRNKKLEFYKYALIIAFALIICLITFYFKYRKTE